VHSVLLLEADSEPLWVSVALVREQGDARWRKGG
jgi:hypothetical protein